MLLLLLAFLGGVLTILSPCILPVVPFVFARAGEPFRRSTLPLLAGMALMFAAVAAAAAAGGNWIVRTNQYGRWAALVVLAVLGLSLLFPALAEQLTRPLVRIGSRLQKGARGQQGNPAAALLLGASIGLLWAPCAGPILGLVLAAAALNGVSGRTLALLLAFALGAAASLAVALLAGGRVFAAMKRGLGAEAWIRRGLGALVLAAVVGIGLGLDTRLLAGVSYLNTNSLEQRLVHRFAPPPSGMPTAVSAMMPVGDARLSDFGPLPALAGASTWINSPPLDAGELQGKVVLVDFWTYSCINCLRTLPYVEAWAAKYSAAGLVVIGVHTPEFAFERDPANVRKAIGDLGVRYPVALDNDHAIWNAFHNQYWPAHYLADAQGRIRYEKFGEGDYAETERAIQQLLAAAGHATGSGTFVQVAAGGAEAAGGAGSDQSPETYLGYDREQNYNSLEDMAEDVPAHYTLPDRLLRNQWGLAGGWTVGFESLQAAAPGAAIAFAFHARDLHLVMGSPLHAVAFRVTLDGHAPGADHGADTDDAGNGVVSGQRLYNLIRLRAGSGDHLFRIEFLAPGAQAFSFTFG